MANERAEALLDAAEIKYEREPDWIEEGRRPDFYCSGDVEFWCEVKTLEPQREFRNLGDALDELQRRVSDIKLPGHGDAYVDGRLSHRDARVVVNLLKRALPRIWEQDGPGMVVALVPADPDYRNFVRFSISSAGGTGVEFHSCVSRTGQYGCPYETFPDPNSQKTKLHFSNGDVREVEAEEVLLWKDELRVAVVAHPHDKPFNVISAMPTGAAWEVRNPERIREAVSDANNQFKNANRYKVLPCILMIFHDGLDVPEDEMIKSALYGDLKYAFRRERSNEGKLILEGNGAWNSDKNRTTSAVIYKRNSGQPLLIHNYWAERPFAAGVLRCREIIVRQDGTFENSIPV